MSNGFRQQPQGSTKDKFRELQTQLANSQMAGRVTQMMIQRLMENGQSMGTDISSLFHMVNDLQYKIGAIQQLLNVDSDQINKLMAEKRLKDFDEAAASQDAKEGLLPADVVGDDSTITITSSTEKLDQGIFRSRIKLIETASPELIQGLTGQPVGTKVKAKLNGVDHNVELLAIRNPQKVEEPVQAIGPELPPAAPTLESVK